MDVLKSVIQAPPTPFQWSKCYPRQIGRTSLPLRREIVIDGRDPRKGIYCEVVPSHSLIILR